jgi:hypothetical protein
MRIGYIAAAFSALLMATTGSWAAGGGGGPGGGAGGGSTPSKAPIGAPPALNSAELNNAYDFRSRMSSDPVCQDLARKSDSVYANAELENDKKQQELAQIRKQAKAAGCV